MPFAAVPGASLYYEVHGRGPWLVFAHGAGGNHLSWWQQVPAFVDRYRCLVYAQRGWGRSVTAGEPDPARFAGDLLALLDHVEADDAVLVGQSMGGWSVLGATLAAPERVRALVLTGTLAGLTDDRMLATLAARVDPSRPFDGRLALAPDFPARAPAATFLFEQIAGLNPPPSPAFLRALVALRYAVPAGGLPMPVTFLAGEHDQLFPPDLIRQAHAKCSAADLVLVPSAGHSVYFECPDEFNRLLATFLRRLD